jgi:biotin carboxyl carrier protein
MTIFTSPFRSSVSRRVVSRQGLYMSGGLCSSIGQPYQQYTQMQNPELLQLKKKEQVNVSLYYSTSSMITNDLPYHIVVGLPALSPTMENGTLSEWYVSEGDSFSAGDGIAKIETDKAAMDFEAQDDGFVAKILLQAGQGSDRTLFTSKQTKHKFSLPKNSFLIFF